MGSRVTVKLWLMRVDGQRPSGDDARSALPVCIHRCTVSLAIHTHTPTHPHLLQYECEDPEDRQCPFLDYVIPDSDVAPYEMKEVLQ